MILKPPPLFQEQEIGFTHEISVEKATPTWHHEPDPISRRGGSTSQSSREVAITLGQIQLLSPTSSWLQLFPCPPWAPWTGISRESSTPLLTLSFVLCSQLPHQSPVLDQSNLQFTCSFKKEGPRGATGAFVLGQGVNMRLYDSWQRNFKAKGS